MMSLRWGFLRMRMKRKYEFWGDRRKCRGTRRRLPSRSRRQQGLPNGLVRIDEAAEDGGLDGQPGAIRLREGDLDLEGEMSKGGGEEKRGWK